jgi:hypothetical protein
MTVGGDPEGGSSEVAISTWNLMSTIFRENYLGQSSGVRRNRFFNIFARGLKPVVNGSGISEKALINPFRFFCLNIRKMKASQDVATTFSA